MKQNVGLRLLGDIMGWDDARAREEFRWLSLMSRMKYDGYRDFLAGVRFIESLADWLQQFALESERHTAYQFIRNNLVYIGPAEMQHLVELAYSETFQRRLVTAVAQQLDIPTYCVWTHPGAAELYRSLLRRTLFLGLSDGARMDALRRANAGIISNEQVVVGAQLDPAKWQSILSDLRRDEHDDNARFAFVYLLDDFVGSGKTLLRQEDDGAWKGKLVKFWDLLKDVRESHFELGLVLCVHHYIGTFAASRSVIERNAQVRQARAQQWFQHVEFTFGTILPQDLPVDEQRFGEFVDLMRKYYDAAVETGHTEVGGTDMRFGFGMCALPLILEHNTPNNSITLLWADTPGENGQHAMRPLFRRRQRHS